MLEASMAMPACDSNTNAPNDHLRKLADQTTLAKNRYTSRRHGSRTLDQTGRPSGHFALFLDAGRQPGRSDPIVVLYDPIVMNEYTVPLGDFERNWSSYALIIEAEANHRSAFGITFVCLFLVVVGACIGYHYICRRRSLGLAANGGSR